MSKEIMKKNKKSSTATPQITSFFKKAENPELQSEFKVKINISMEDHDDERRTVEVIGSQDNVSKAMTKINEKLGSGGGEGADDDKPREQYNPPEANEDDMFKNPISAGINFDKFDSIEVKITENGGGIAKADTLNQFTNDKLRTLLLENIIQSGQDLMALSQTCSTSLTAYISPIFAEISKESTIDLKCIIVAPTKESVIKIHGELIKLAKGSSVKALRTYGIPSRQYHANKLVMEGCNILVMTPGLLFKNLAKGFISFNKLKYLVLDEVDRMLEMDFKKKIENVKNHASFQKEKVQVLMFSATFPQDIQQLARNFLHNYVFLAVGIVGGASSETDVLEIKLQSPIQETSTKMRKVHSIPPGRGFTYAPRPLQMKYTERDGFVFDEEVKEIITCGPRVYKKGICVNPLRLEHLLQKREILKIKSLSRDLSKELLDEMLKNDKFSHILFSSAKDLSSIKTELGKLVNLNSAVEVNRCLLIIKNKFAKGPCYKHFRKVLELEDAKKFCESNNIVFPDNDAITDAEKEQFFYNDNVIDNPLSIVGFAEFLNLRRVKQQSGNENNQSPSHQNLTRQPHQDYSEEDKTPSKLVASSSSKKSINLSTRKLSTPMLYSSDDNQAGPSTSNNRSTTRNSKRAHPSEDPGEDEFTRFLKRTCIHSYPTFEVSDDDD